MGNIDRQKIFEREEFDDDYKEKIAAKSDHKCCHCGKEVYFGYGATIDHFVPLFQGGTNRDINLIMLCKDCNKSKKDHIYAPENYCRYLNKNHLDELSGYFESYVSSFDYLSRHNLLCLDEYMVKIPPINVSDRFIKRHHKQNALFIQQTIRRAFPEDIDKLTEYLYRYAEKYDILASREELVANIEFWLNFGCIYYIEKNKDIKLVCTITVTDLSESGFLDAIKNTLSITVFSYYCNDNAATLAGGTAEKLPRLILNEQGLKQIPVRYNVARGDKIRWVLPNGACLKETGDSDIFFHSYTIGYVGEQKDLPKLDEDTDLMAFFDKFKNVSKEMDRWIEEHDCFDLAWMKNEIYLKGSGKDKVDSEITRARISMSSS